MMYHAPDGVDLAAGLPALVQCAILLIFLAVEMVKLKWCSAAYQQLRGFVGAAPAVATPQAAVFYCVQGMWLAFWSAS